MSTTEQDLEGLGEETDIDENEQKSGSEVQQELGESDADLRFETKKFALQALLEKASSVLPTKDIMPVLKNFQIEVEAGQIRVVATDLELSVIADSPLVTVTRQGTAVFPGKRLLDLVKEAEDGLITIDVAKREGESGSSAHIEVARATWDLKLVDGSDYPALPDLTEVKFHHVDRVRFISAINAVRYAASVETTRPSLMMIDISESRMRASDGVRFQQADVHGWPKTFNIQIPINAVDDLMKLLKITELDEIEIGETTNQLVFRVGADVFLANKITADFPPVDEMLLAPALTNKEKLDVDRQDFISAIKRVRIAADTELPGIILKLETTGSGLMTVHTRDKFGNTAAETLDVNWQHSDKEIAFNHSHLLDMLNMTDVKSCSFFLGENTPTRPTPIMLKDDDAGTLGVLNQIRLAYLQ